MAFKVKVRTAVLSDVKKRLGDLSEAEHNLALKLREVADPYVPSRTGRLANTAQVIDNRLIYHGDGAFVLYVGKRGGQPLTISTQVHPKAQTFWAWGAKKDNAELLRKTAVKEIEKTLRAQK